MNSHSKLSSDKIEGTVFSPRQVRILKIVVIVLGIILVAGFALVVGTIAYQASNLPQKSNSANKSQQFNLPVQLNSQKSGATIPLGIIILSTALDKDQLAITFSDKQGLGVMVVNTRNGSLVSTTRLDLPNFPNLEK